MFSSAPSRLVLDGLKGRRDGRGGGRIVGPPPKPPAFVLRIKPHISEYPR